MKLKEPPEELITAFGLIGYWWNEARLAEKQENYSKMGASHKKLQEAQDNLEKALRKNNHIHYLSYRHK